MRKNEIMTTFISISDLEFLKKRKEELGYKSISELFRKMIENNLPFFSELYKDIKYEEKQGVNITINVLSEQKRKLERVKFFSRSELVRDLILMERIKEDIKNSVIRELEITKRLVNKKDD